MVRDKAFYRNFILLALPIVLQNIITLGVNLADNMMLGRYSEAALSGVTVVNQIQFIYQCILMGLCDALVILATQYWGKKDTDAIKTIASIAMRVGFVVMLVLFCVVSLFPSQILGLFTSDEAIISEGVRYISIIRFTYPLFCATTILLAVLRSTEVVKIAFWTSVSTIIINCCINWVLIYGRLGAPRMGVAGAAIGTLTARAVELVTVCVFLKKKENNLHLVLSDFKLIDNTLKWDYKNVCIPIMIASGLWGLNNAIQTGILGHLSSNAIAANSMASNLYLLVKTMAMGANAATGVIIGTTIGTGDMKKLKEYARTLQVIFVFIGIISGIVLFLLIEPILSLYSFSDESRELARTFLRILSVVIVGMCYQMPTNSGIIKGGGDTKYLLKLDIISIYCIVIPLSFYVAFVLKASPVAVIWCLNLDQIFKCIPAFIKCNFGNWAKKLTR